MKPLLKFNRLLVLLALLFVFIHIQKISAQDTSYSQIINKKTFRISKSLSDYIPFIADAPFASPDGRHIMYVTKKGKKVCVGLDGEDQMEFDVINHLAFSPDGKRTAYIATKNKQSFLVIDGKVEGMVDKIPSPPSLGATTQDVIEFVTERIGFTPDSKKVYYRDEKGWHIDDKIYNYKLAPTFSPDGSRFAFCNSGLERNFIFIDGVEHPLNGVVIGSQIHFSPDSKHFAFMTIRPEGVFVNIDGKESPVLGNIEAKAYPQRKYKKDLIVYDVGNWGKPVIIFSPDSKRFSYWGYTNQGKGIVVVEDGKISPEYQFISTPVYSPDSKHFLYAASKDNESWIFLNGEKHIPIDKNLVNSSLRINFNAKRIVYSGLSLEVVGKSKHRVGIDSTLDPNEYDYMSKLEFSPDGNHVVYVAIEKTGTYFAPGRRKNVRLVMDSTSKEIDGFFIKTLGNKVIFFDSNEKFRYSIFNKINKDEFEVTLIEETFNPGK